jgi:phage gp37-like protein
VLRLTSARSAGTLDASFDALIDRAATELDAARSAPHGVRGAARQALIDRLESLDRELLQQARVLLDDRARTALAGQANEELAPFRGRMDAEAFARARDRAIDRLVRERYALPVVAYRY